MSTPADQRQQWYQDQATDFGFLARSFMRATGDRLTSYSEHAAVDYARLAAHFGRLALPQEQPIADAYRDWANALRGYCCPVCDYRMPHPAEEWYICAQCGTEFNYDDANTSHAELRARWKAAGSVFWARRLSDAD